MKLSELKNKRIAILGYGKEGRSTLRFLQQEKITDVTILDANQHLALELKWEKCVLGKNYMENLWDFDLIFKSPGVSPFQQALLPYRDRFTSQTEVFFSNYTGKVIGITGTKGKSTCSTLLYECLRAGGYDVQLVWNIGKPVLDEVDIRRGKEHDYVIYELSSYMLQDFVPKLEIWYINNIFPCHLDWHYDSFNIYRETKVNILRDTKYAVVHGDLWTDSEVLSLEKNKIYFDTKGEYCFEKNTFLVRGIRVYEWEVRLLWIHNKKNICWVIAILDILLQDTRKISDILMQVLPSFWGLPNRIEDIGEYEGIRFINDAIATTPESTIAAIHTFGGSLQTLFIGGEDSGFDFQSLRDTILQSNIQNIIAFPETGEKIFPEIQVRDYEKAFEVEIEWKILQCMKTRCMKTWVDFAFRTTLPWRVALLSCGAPSFSLWESYTQKAEQFITSVRSYL